MNPELMRVTLSCTHLQQARAWRKEITPNDWATLELITDQTCTVRSRRKRDRVTSRSAINARITGAEPPLTAGSWERRSQGARWQVVRWYFASVACGSMSSFGLCLSTGLVCRRRVVWPVCPLRAAAARTASEERWLLRCGARGREG